MKKKEKKQTKIKLIILIGVILVGLWFAVAYPYMTLKKNEKKVENAARRYFEINSAQLPTGTRVKTVSLKELYHQSYLKEDVPIPYTNKVCSPEKSWVKVRKEKDGQYKYYTFLDCGLFSSNIDHKGPTINLNGEKEITIGKDEEYKDAGVKSVSDNVDGNMAIKNVQTVNRVNTSEIGTYDVEYIAYDSLNNKTVVTRKVTVVQKIYNTISKELKEEKNFKGQPTTNYLRLSNILFRIYGIDENKNIILIADEDLANVNYSKLDKWLDYFYGKLNKTAQEMIVESKYCNEPLDDANLGTKTCGKETKARKVYIPSIADINKAYKDGSNFANTYTLSWTANEAADGKVYTTRRYALGTDSSKKYFLRDADEIYGVRPMITIKGDTKIVEGDGTIGNPYSLGDVPKVKAGDKLNTRYVGEYITIKEEIYRIVNVENDGTVKVISEATVGGLEDDVTCMASPENDVIKYNPKDKDSTAYFINNRVSSYIDVTHFVNHEISVPVYKNKIIYGKETKTNKYTVKLSAPDIFELFSAQPQRTRQATSYWTLNCSNAERTGTGITDIGVPVNETIPAFGRLGVRVVAYVKNTEVVGGGNGTLGSPYRIG